MANLLHIDSSPRGDRSHSRRLTAEFVAAWKQTHPADTITYGDVGRNLVPHVIDCYLNNFVYSCPTGRIWNC